MNWKLWRKSRNEDLDEEIAHDLAAETTENLRSGMSHEDASRRSRKEFGNVSLVKESTRETWGWTSLERLVQDLRYAFRQLARSPGFALVAILSLGLGIGANTSIFTLINAMMLKSLPVSHAEELVVVTLSSRDGKGWGSLTHRLWEQLRDQPGLFNGSFAYAATRVELNVGDDARPVPAGLVSGGFFSTLGFHAALGRLPVAADDRPGCPAIAAISHSFWQSEFGGSPGVLGKSVTLEGRSFEIVGVTEPGFFGIEYGFQVPVWAPLCSEATLFGSAAGANSSMSRVVMGRLPRGVSSEQAQARVAALTPAILEATIPPNATADAIARYRASTFGVLPFSKGIPDLSRNYGQPLLILMGVVAVVLLIACANIANLLLARAAARQREIAVRLSLGASRSRLIRQLLTESILLSLLGAAAGMLFAIWGSRLLLGLMARPGRVVLDLTPDPTVLAFTLGAGILTGVLFGLAPAWRAVRVDLHLAMKPGSRAAATDSSGFGAGKLLVAAQIALSLVLVVGAGLLLGSWRRLVTIDPGFRSDRVLLIGANLRTAGAPATQRALLYRQALDRLRALPGVEAGSAAARTPIGNVNWNTTIEVDGFTPVPGDNVRVQLNEVSEDYFETIGTTLLAGRDFATSDRPTSPLVGIVSEEVARKFFGGAAALGRTIRARSGTRLDPPLQIVGIVSNTKDQSLREPSPPQVYFALSQDPSPGVSFNFALRTAGPPAAIVSAAKAAIMEIDPRFSLSVTTLDQQIDESVRLPRSLGLLAGFFGALALLLASIGLYGVMSYAVARRRTEIGIRIALGAERRRVIRMVLGDVARIVIVGIAIGLIASLMLTRLASGLLFGVAPNDPLILTISALTLVTVALAAAIIPARRAANLDPMTALRED